MAQNNSRVLISEKCAGKGVIYIIVSDSFNPFPNDKILDWSKFKAFADDKTNVSKKSKFVMGSVGNIIRKGENAGYQHFLLFPPCFQQRSFPDVKSRDFVAKS